MLTKELAYFCILAAGNIVLFWHTRGMISELINYARCGKPSMASYMRSAELLNSLMSIFLILLSLLGAISIVAELVPRSH